MAALLTSACGTTVPSGLTSTAGLPSNEPGLGAPAATGPTPGVAAPSAVPGRGRASTAGPAALPTSAPTAPGSATADRSPVLVGVVATNNDAAGSAGVDNGNTVTPRRAFEAAVAAWNARGGLAGRRIVPVYDEIASSAASFSTELERVCASFTQDRRVALVVSMLGLYVEEFGACLARAGIPWIPTDYALGDETALRSSSSLLTPSTVTTDVRLTTLLRQLAATGRLKRGERLGVVVEGCPFNRRTFARTVQPLARELGVPVTDHAESRCFLGIGDLSGLAAEMQNAVLRFQTSGVDHVLFVSGAMEGNLVLFFLTAAQAQQFHPRYALTSAAAPVVQEQNTPAEQLANAVGVGWLPDTDTRRTTVGRPAQKQCLSALRRAGLTPAAPADRSFAFGACDALALSDALLRRTRGRTELPAVLTAASSLTFASAMSLAGRTDFSGGRRAGAGAARVFAWSAGCGCFDYTGPTFRLG